MRKIIFSIPITLDGFIEGPHRELDWVIPDDELHDFYTGLLERADSLIYGRVTYELMVNYWPTAASDPNATEAEKRFANALNPKHKIVYSKTLTQVAWNTELRDTFSPDEIRALKAQDGGDILLGGGASMAQEFFRQRLVDEYLPVIQPVAIGRGKALFNGLQEQPSLDYMWNQRFRSGAVALCYHMNGKLQAKQ